MKSSSMYQTERNVLAESQDGCEHQKQEVMSL